MAVASFHLARFATADAARAMARVPLDRRALRRAPGATFAKLLGTGHDTRMTASADLRRWAVFAVWDSPADLGRARREHPVLRRWDDLATERYDLTLEPLGARGTWDGVDPTAGATPAASDGTGDEPVAVLTRATVRWRRLPAFLAAVPPVEDTLAAADGLLARLGIGEVPVGRQATFSLWRDADAMRAFARRDANHAEAVRRTRDEGWYAEEWFARFRPVDRSGTWDGGDPLGALADRGGNDR